MRVKNNCAEVAKQLRNFNSEIEKEVKTAKQQTLQRVFDRSQELVPVLTGELKNSGHMTEDSVIYDAPHAREIEEDVSMYHDDGTSKYLESSVNEQEKLMQSDFESATEKAFKKVVK